MKVMDSDEAASYRLLGNYQQVDAGLGVVSTGRAGTVRVNGSKVHSTVTMLQVYLPPWHQCHSTPLQGVMGGGRVIYS